MDRKKILIVDDEKDVLRVLDRRLVMAGFDIISADNGLLALSMAKLNQPDLIMLDVQMPKIDGGETARRLKADQMTKHIPILFLTALISSEESARMKYYRGGSIVLAKSIDITEFVSIINKVIFNIIATGNPKKRSHYICPFSTSDQLTSYYVVS